MVGCEDFAEPEPEEAEEKRGRAEKRISHEPSLARRGMGPETVK